MLYPARAILALDMSPFGPTLALLPAIRALRASYPRAFLVAAACTGSCELLTAAGLVDETISLGVIKSSDAGSLGAFKRLARLTRGARRFNFDLVLDFEPRLETQIVSSLVLRAPALRPPRLPRAIEMLLDLGGVPRRPRNVSSNYSNVLGRAGIETGDTRLRITSSSEEDTRFEKTLARSGSRGGEPIVLLFAADAKDRRGWPVESFGEIGVRLANNFGARIVAADEPSDRGFTDAVSALLPPGAIKLAEPRALELVAAIARASIAITDERAIAQLASELGTPVIEVADRAVALASSSKDHRIVHSSLRRRVLTDEVYENACELIQESRSPSLFQRP